MAKMMMDYIAAQPEVWKSIYSGRSEIASPFAAAFAEKKPEQLLLIGSGSSYNAACCVQRLYAELLGIRATPCMPTRAENMFSLCPPASTAAVVISQSGESTSTIAVVRQLKERAYKTVSLTQTPDSTVARACDIPITLACGEERIGPKTKGFTATVLTLQIMALELARALGFVREAEAIEAQLEKAFELAPASIAASCEWAGKMSACLAGAPHILLVADGENYEAMSEGALKLLETLYIPCMHYEFEEYLHGVQCTIAQGSHLIILAPDDRNRERMLRLAAFNQAHGGVSYLITTGRPAHAEGELFLHSADSPWTGCYDVLLPMQVISAVVSEAKGIDCDHSKFPTFIHDLGTKNW